MGGIGETEQSDEQLIARVAGRDREAFERLYHRYHRRLYGYLARLVRRPELIEEALDDTMFAVWRQAARFEHRSAVSTWILGIAHRTALKAIARDDRWTARARAEVAEQASVDPSEPAAGIVHGERRAVIDRALAALSPEHRAVVVLTYFDERSYEEIAAIVGCPVNTVKTRMFHARKSLRRLLPALGWSGV